MTGVSKSGTERRAENESFNHMHTLPPTHSPHSRVSSFARSSQRTVTCAGADDSILLGHKYARQNDERVLLARPFQFATPNPPYHRLAAASSPPLLALLCLL
ncbi:hypothetical protein BDM02DRAFT_3113067 [Thelephora ganbajun]|uniref:Uncharacterized protein n=1 Tax=Thelephora ganbajun TaxID=370292 RepID=A0ACB6ZJV3_THEGA|nr:hypothetical protein BDM02DRAFT_3113067 [Thelephora ganbajun]